MLPGLPTCILAGRSAMVNSNEAEDGGIMVKRTDVYRLRFANDGIGPGKTVEFCAEDASEALIIARDEAANRDVKLWKGERFLCHLKHNTFDVREIS